MAISANLATAENSDRESVLLAQRFERSAAPADVRSPAPAVTAFERALDDSRDNRQVAQRREPVGPWAVRVSSGNAAQNADSKRG